MQLQKLRRDRTFISSYVTAMHRHLIQLITLAWIIIPMTLLSYLLSNVLSKKRKNGQYVILSAELTQPHHNKKTQKSVIIFHFTSFLFEEDATKNGLCYCFDVLLFNSLYL